MSEPAEVLTDSDRMARDMAAAELARELKIDRSSAETLVGAGYRSPEEVRTLSDETLLSLGIGTGAIDRLKGAGSAAHAGPPPAGPAGAQAVERWMASVRKTEAPKRKIVVRPKDSTDVLRKWVDGDDRALEDWIGASGGPAMPVPEPDPEDGRLAEGVSFGETETSTELTTSGTPGVMTLPTVPTQLIDREATLVHWLTDLLDRVKSDQFDPATLLQEVQDLHRQLYDERSRVKQLEEELEHVKRGSIAVIKFVRSREARARDQALHERDAEIAELKLKLMTPEDLDDPHSPPGAGRIVPASGTNEAEEPDTEAGGRDDSDLLQRSQAFADREAELSRRIVQLEGEVHKLRSEAQARDQSETLRRVAPSKVSRELEERIEKAEVRERELARRESEVRSKFEELRIHADEIEHQGTSLSDRERQFATAEETLARQRTELAEESEKLAASREAFGDTQKMIEASPELQKMREELERFDTELKARDQLLVAKTQELEALQARLGQLEQEFRPAETTPAQGASGKIHTGVRRLDDLMFGGLPAGAQVLLNGPAHTGKEVLARLFIAEGLKQGIPGLWVVSDKTYLQIREEMTQLLPNYPNFEQQGMVRYIDLYSRSLGVTQADAAVRLLSTTDKGVLDQILAGVNSISTDFKERAPTYRLVFESVSTVTAYLDSAQTLRFLQPFAGRRKLDSAASYYLLETGMHSEADLQTLEHMMDGSLHLKVEALKTFLSIRGLTEVQSRAWIGYTFTKKAFSLGSFSLDKIR